MKKILIIALFLLPLPVFGQALSGINGDCQIGGQQALTSGLPSTATQQIGTANVNAGAGVAASFPSCLVTVYATGTTNKANIYSDNSVSPHLLSNPFVANTDGSFTLFVAAGCYDVVMSSGAGPRCLTSGHSEAFASDRERLYCQEEAAQYQDVERSGRSRTTRLPERR